MVKCVFCKDKPECCASCDEKNRKAKEARRKAKARRKERAEVLKSLGLTPVKGVVSGKTYWE